ncbi:MAG: MerR family transcriptional regulator [Planctomycetota bacterium]|nr:MerR family transcriptional regulator [Planctomycetota bacterium]
MAENDPEIFTLAKAGETLGVTVQDIQSYIAEGLVEPRSDTSGAPYFTRVEMRRLWSIVTLSRDVGINLPGVAAVLTLREQYERMRRDLETLIEIVERELGPDCWDRLWPEGRPRPETHISVDGVTDPEGDKPEQDGPGPETPPAGG